MSAGMSSKELETWLRATGQYAYQNAMKAQQNAKAISNAREAEMRLKKNLRGPLVNLNTPNSNKKELTKEALNKRAKELEGLFGSFEVTKQGLNNRGKELEGLFGGRKTRRRKVQKRKTRRLRR